LTLFGGLDVATVNSLFGNLEEVISVNDGLEEEYNSLRDESGQFPPLFTLNLLSTLKMCCLFENCSKNKKI
jgi:hypothetical protein